MLHIDMSKALMLQLHLRELQDELEVASGVLKADFFDLTKNERAHFNGVKAEARCEIPFAVAGEDPAFKNITARESHF